MKIPYVKNIKNSFKTFFAKNICDILKVSVNATCDSEGDVQFYGLEQVSSVSPLEECIYIQKVSDRIFYYTKTKQILYLKNGLLTNLEMNFVDEPIIVEIVVEGVKRPLIINGQGKGFVIQDDGDVVECALPIGDNACVYNRMLFIAKDNIIHFSAVDNYTDFNMDLNRGGIIKTDEIHGKILSLVVNANKLVILTENAIYEFNAHGERMDYTLEMITKFSILGMLYKTVKSYNDKILFVKDNKVFTYSNKKVTEIKTVLKENEVVAVNSAGITSEAYCVAVKTADNTSKIMYVDIDGKLNCLIDSYLEVVCDGGYTIDKQGKLYKIILNPNENTNVIFKSFAFHLGTAKEKIVHVISLFSQQDGEMIFVSEYGSKTFNLKKGANVKRMNLPAKNFQLVFSGQTGFHISQIRIEYRIKEN